VTYHPYPAGGEGGWSPPLQSEPQLQPLEPRSITGAPSGNGGDGGGEHRLTTLQHHLLSCIKTGQLLPAVVLKDCSRLLIG